MDTMIDQGALWEQYSRTGEQRTKEELILTYIPLVHSAVASVVRRLPAVLDMQDAVNTGTIGLIQAIDHFEPSRGTKFATYAFSRIRGEVIDELRRIDWVSRAARGRQKTIENTRSILSQTLGRSPSQQEMSDSLDPADAQFARTTGLEATFVLSLDQLLNVGVGDDEQQAIGDRLADQSSASPDDLVERLGLHDALVAAIGQLRARDREVIALHYRGEMTHSEIGRRLGVSDSRICQIHARAIGHLRNQLAKWASPRAESRPAGSTRQGTSGRVPAVAATSKEFLRLNWRSALRAAA